MDVRGVLSSWEYIEVTAPITGNVSGETEGVMLVSVSTDTIADSLAVLEGRAGTIEIVVGLILILVAVLIGIAGPIPFKAVDNIS